MKTKNIADIYPLSPLQQGMLFHTLYAPQSGMYCEQLGVTFHVALDVSVFKAAWQAVTERHTILRTAFVWDELDEPLQIVRRHINIPWEEHDLRALSEAEQATRIGAFREAEYTRGFELSQAPLMRLALLRLSQDTYHFVWTHHHLLLDGWSVMLVLDEVSAYYTALLQGQAPDLPYPRPFHDYIAWLQTQDLPAAERFWRAYLAGFTAPTPLPAAWPAGEAPFLASKETCAEQEVYLCRSASSALYAFARQNRLTFNVVMQGAWALLLARHSHAADDIIFGTTVSTRPPALAGVESMVGLFINTLPMRARIPARAQLLPWLQQLQEEQAEARQFDYAPLAQIQSWSVAPRGQSLFDSLLVVENYPLTTIEQTSVSGLPMQHISWGTEQTNYPLSLTVGPGEAILLRLGYHKQRFSEQTITRLLGRLQTLLESMVAHPDRAVMQLPLAPAEETHVLLHTWNQDTRSDQHSICLPALFEQQVARTPASIAANCDGQTLTYAQLNRKANQLAHYLCSLGVGPETLVGLCLERSLDMVVCMLGILKAGGAYLPLDPTYPQKRLAFMLADARAALVITSSALLAERNLERASYRAICLDRDWETIAASATEDPANTTSPEHAAYLIYTSGSTGQPKGVVVSHRNIVASTSARFAYYENPVGRFLLLSSMAFDSSVAGIFWTLCQGGCLLLPAFDFRDDPQHLLDLMQEQQVSHLLCVPALYAALLAQAEPEALASLRTVIVAGESCPLQLAERHAQQLPRAAFFNEYGPTEGTVWSSVYQYSAGDRHLQLPIGRPIAGAQVYILDQYMELALTGVAGELYIGGVGVARGYLHRPDLTAERFLPHPFTRQAGARLYRTGDRARYLPDSNIEFLGRADQQVKVRGYRIELGEIEAVLRLHPLLREAIVDARELQAGAKQLVAYILPKGEQAPAPSVLRDFLSAILPDYMIPAAFVTLDVLPLMPNGKLDRRALPAPERNRPTSHKAYTAPRTPSEELLADLWASVLKLERVGIHDNFFELGGDSILSLQIVAKAHTAGLPLTPRSLFQHPTISQLAVALSSAATVTLAVEQGLALGPVSLTPIQRWFFDQDLAEPHHWNQAMLLRARQTLDPHSVQAAVQALLVHHDALRLRAQRQEDGWRLSHAAPSDQAPFTYENLANLPPQEQALALEAATDRLQASLDLANGPIVRAALFDLGPTQPARLLLVIHHLAVDIVSWSILLEDLQTAYQQVSQRQSQRQPVADQYHLPPKTTSFQHWAQRLHEYAQSAAARSDLDFWLNQAWVEVEPLPLDFAAERSANTEMSTQKVIVSLSREETEALLTQVPAAYHTHINDALLTALVQAFARWTGTRCLLLDLEGHGREEILDGVDLSRTVGWFTSLTPLALTVDSGAGPGEALKSIKEQLRRVPRSGITFGLLRYLCQDASIRQRLSVLPQPGVSFNYTGRSAFAPTGQGLFAPAAEPFGPMHSLNNRRSHLLDIVGGILDGRLYLEWAYSDNFHHRATIERLASLYLEVLSAIILHCQSPSAGGYTPSDFPEARLSQAALDALLSELARTAATETPASSGANLEALYPLSPTQEGMLFHSLYAPQSDIYFEQMSITLRGALDVSAFKQSWRQVVERHSILRTLFLWEQLENPLQVARRHVALPWTELDWRLLPSREQHVRLQGHLRADREQRFNLSQAPVMRLNLIRLDERVYHLTWSSHHLLLDGWSASTVLAEVLMCYKAYTQQQSPALPPTRPYRDYIAWLQQQDLSQAEGFWRNALRGFSTPTPLGVDRPINRSPETSPDYHDELVRISAKTTAVLYALARQQQLTLNTLVQGTWALLLARYSGEWEVVFGSTVSGRPAELAGVESMVGLFINTLPTRAQMKPQQSLLSWLQALQAQQAEARQYEYSPLASIQSWSEVPRGQPLFESLLVFDNYPVDRSLDRSGSLEIEFAIGGEWTNYPLMLVVSPDDSLLIRISYMGSRFDAATIQRMGGHVATILDAIATHPDQPLATIPLLTAAEQRQAVIEWNATESPYPDNRCLHQLFEAQVSCAPDAIALIHEQHWITYAELNSRADSVARYLQELGVASEDLVGLSLERSIDMVTCMLGVLKAGGAYVPLDPAYPLDRLTYIAQHSRLVALLTQQHLLSKLPPCKCPLVCVNAHWPAIAQAAARPGCALLQPDNLAYVIYTSGSTGQPKGVQITHRSVINFMTAMQARPGICSQDVLLAVTSLSFDIAALELFLPLLAGARVEALNRELTTDGLQLAERLRLSGATILQATPYTWRMLILAGWNGTADLKMLCGGEALPSDLADSLLQRGASLWNMYGPTETTIWSSAQRVQPGAAQYPIVPVGMPIANTQLYVLDAQWQLAPVGVPGELYIGGAGLARGYLNRPDLTAARFVPHPFSAIPGARLYSTGDRVRYHADGALEYLGRVDFQIKLRGYRIELGEIEAILRQHPAIGEAVVVAQERAQAAMGHQSDAAADNRLVAYIVQRHSAQQDISPAWSAKQVDYWQQVWQTTYQESGEPQETRDPAFNLAGWKSSYTGQPLPQQEMREWVDSTVERILSLLHTGSQQSNAVTAGCVLEIGCGTGLLLSRIAPYCQEYWATDFSPVALQTAQNLVAEQALSNVKLLQRAADDYSGSLAEQAGCFDAVILNSVTQYFPDRDYLARVLQGALRLVAPGGFLFVGDVRNLLLLEAFHTSLQLRRAPLTLVTDQLRGFVQRQLTYERELLIAPDFFTALQQHPVEQSQGQSLADADQRRPISHVEIQLKRGQHHNELTRFRYDATLHVERAVEPLPEHAHLHWQQEQLTLSAVRRLLEQQQPAALHLLAVPNARLSTDMQVVSFLHGEAMLPRIEDVWEAARDSKRNDIDPEDVWRLGDTLPYTVTITYTPGAPACFDALLCWRATSEGSAADMRKPLLACLSQHAPEPRLPWQQCTNNPIQAEQAGNLVPELRAYLKHKLPDYMLPAAIMQLDAFPMTPNGKIDRKALPAPDGSRPTLKSAFVAPRSAVEKTLADIWSHVLGIEQVGIHDNFFELGGDSLMTIRVVTRANQARLGITVKHLFQHQTIAELAQDADSTRVLAEQGLVTGRVGIMPLHHMSLDPGMGDPTNHSMCFIIEAETPFDPRLVEQVVRHLLMYHDMLRLKAIQNEHGWQLSISDMHETLPFRQVDFSHVPEVEQGPAIKDLGISMTMNFVLAVEPMLRVALCSTGPNKPTPLIIIVHSFAADMESWQFLLEDFKLAYQQLQETGEIHFPRKTTSFKQWTDRLEEYAQSEQARAEIPFWLLEARKHAPAPAKDFPDGVDDGPSLEMMVALFEPEETQQLLQFVARKDGLRMDAIFLTAVAQAFTQWMEQRLLHVRIESYGREPLFEDIDLSHTVGSFAIDYPMLFDLREAVTLESALTAVHEQLSRIPHNGMGYCALSCLSPDPRIVQELAAVPRPEIYFNYLGPLLAPGVDGYKVSGPYNGRVYTLHTVKKQPASFIVNCSLADGQFQLAFYFSTNQYRADTIRRLGRAAREEVRAMLKLLQ